MALDDTNGFLGYLEEILWLIVALVVGIGYAAVGGAVAAVGAMVFYAISVVGWIIVILGGLLLALVGMDDMLDPLKDLTMRFAQQGTMFLMWYVHNVMFFVPDGGPYEAYVEVFDDGDSGEFALLPEIVQ